MSSTSRLSVLCLLPALAVSGCYVVPVTTRDGSVQYYTYPFLPPPTAPVNGNAYPYAPVAPPGVPAGPIVLPARLYPTNDAATQTGVVSGTVTNMLNGKGRFQLDYRGEIMTGEATSVDGDARRGMASAAGSNGGHISCG